MVRKTKSESKKKIADIPEEDPQRVSDGYVIRLIKGKYKVIKFNSKRMKLRRVALDDDTERVERTYTKAEVDKLMKKIKIDKSIEPIFW